MRTHLYAPSLLDKLLATDVDTQGRGTVPRLDVNQVKESVARDIETLLNARPSFDAADLSAFPNVARSLLTFGMIDITSLSIASDRDRAQITHAIENALADHEPRLTDVQVVVNDNSAAGGGLHFSIRARLRLTPGTQPVTFDAVLQPGSNRYAVSRNHARSSLRDARNA